MEDYSTWLARQKWLTSKAGNPWIVSKKKNATVYQKDNKFKIVVDNKFFSTTYDTQEQAKEAALKKLWEVIQGRDIQPKPNNKALVD